MDGLIDRMLDDAELILRPIADNPELSAIEKLRSYFDAGGRWKVAQKAFMLDLLRIWRSDTNALMRQKQEAAAMKRIAPVLAEIIRQGIAEGVFSTKYPEQFGSMLMGLSRGFEDRWRTCCWPIIPRPTRWNNWTRPSARIPIRWNGSWARPLVPCRWPILKR